MRIARMIAILATALSPSACISSTAPPAPDLRPDGIARGDVHYFEYPSSVTGGRFRAAVYTPPGYSAEGRYPVLYLLHGIWGDETSWIESCHADAILDRLFSEEKIVPAIVIMPGAIAKDDPAGHSLDRDQRIDAWRRFEKVFFTDLMPMVESSYPIAGGPRNHAVAGNSIGGGAALLAGLAHPDRFAWVASFSASPNVAHAAKEIRSAAAANRDFSLIWISCGKEDDLFPVSRLIHEEMESRGIRHAWHTEPGGHDADVWKNDVNLLVPQLFRDARLSETAETGK